MVVLAGVEIPLVLVLIPLTFFLLYLYSTWPYSQLKQLGISGPPPQPFFGNQLQMNSRGTLTALLEWSKKYGRVYGIYLGRQPLLVIKDLDILKEIMVKDFGHFTDRWTLTAAMMDKTVKSGVFFAEGADWRRIRNIITPTFSAGKLKMMEHFINRCSEDLVDNLEQIAQKGGKVDVKEYFGAFTMDVITGTAFGLRVNSQKDLNEPFVVNVKKMMELTGRLNVFLTLFLLVPWLAPMIQFIRKKFFPMDTLRFLLESIDTMVQQRKDEKDERPVDFLQLMINAEASNDAVASGSSKRLTREEIAGQAFIFFVAGYETTATTLQYLSYNLAMHPDVQEKIVQEMQQELGEDKPTYENVGKLKYLEQAIHETLRLFPPVTFVTRQASETVTIGGVTIPKGYGVVVPICDVLRDPENFPEPELFKPERFSSSNKSEMQAISFLAFGFGPRLCIGMRLAMLEIKVAMAHVLRKMRFVRTPDLPEKVEFRSSGGLLPPASPLMVKTVLRDSD